jgi:hypothetical protein
MCRWWQRAGRVTHFLRSCYSGILFVKGDKYLDSDAVFGTKDSLIIDFIRLDSEEEAARYHVAAPFYYVEYDFVLKPRG